MEKLRQAGEIFDITTAANLIVSPLKGVMMTPTAADQLTSAATTIANSL